MKEYINTMLGKSSIYLIIPSYVLMVSIMKKPEESLWVFNYYYAWNNGLIKNGNFSSSICKIFAVFLK